jgi:raffinose/stachyose/melibiose transport system substrate-binding protein
MSRFSENDIILKNYRIEKSIGQGAFGEVYLATHLGLNGKRAVKVLLRDEVGIGSVEYDEYRNRFRQESQLMEWFNHPNIIRVYDFQEEDNTLFLIMEYASGGSLKQKLDDIRNKNGRFDVTGVVELGIDVAEGLTVMHKRDVIHRDLKPSNILFDAEGHAKVADLGLAQVPGGASLRSQLSLPKAHPGTPMYMSPEQEISGVYLRPSSDIYSLGLILFECFTNRSYKNIRPGTHIRELVPEVPEWFDALLLRMLSDSPKERPWDGTETAEELRKGLQAGDAAMREAREKEQQESLERARLAEQQRIEEERIRKIQEERAHKEALEKARLEEEEKQKQAARERLQKEAEERVRLAAEEKARQEAELKTRQEEKEKARLAEQERIRKAAEERIKKEAEEKARLQEKINQLETRGKEACVVKDWSTARQIVKQLKNLGDDGHSAALRLKTLINEGSTPVWKKYWWAGAAGIMVIAGLIIWQAGKVTQSPTSNPSPVAITSDTPTSISTLTALPVLPATMAVTPTIQKSTAAANPTKINNSGQKVTINWWHVTTSDPGKSDWQKMADDYMKAHPNVDIKITVMENEGFKTKLTTVLQAGEVPDIFQSWGGGALYEQIDAGLLKDITADLDANNGEWRNSFAPGALGLLSKDGKYYGVPWDMGMIGWWYNKDLFKKAGIDKEPATWSEFLIDVKKLKDAGITPIALGEGDSWTGMHIWSYLATRVGGEKAFNAALDGSGSFADPAFVKAGEELKKLITLKPFQDGYLRASHDEMQAAFGNGKAAMELSGQWAPIIQSINSADGKGVKNLGMFGFPAVEGGVGDGSDVIGGGNGFAIGKNATPEAIDFVKYLTNKDNQTIIAASGSGIPVVKGAEAGLTDPNMKLVQEEISKAAYFQLYYDQFLPSAVGGAINDNTQKLFAGTASPEQVAKAIAESAKAN